MHAVDEETNECEQVGTAGLEERIEAEGAKFREERVAGQRREAVCSAGSVRTIPRRCKGEEGRTNSLWSRSSAPVWREKRAVKRGIRNSRARGASPSSAYHETVHSSDSL